MGGRVVTRPPFLKPTRNHGENMKIQYTVDWFNFTVKNGKHTRMGNVDNRYIQHERGMNGYTTSLRFLDGRIENTSPENPVMGTQIIFSGSALANFQDMYSKHFDNVLEHYACLDGKATRFDVAIDVRNSGMTYDDFKDAIESNKVKCKVPRNKFEHYGNFGDDGWTIYIGRGSKHRYLRIYDKGAESKNGQDWVRIELQCNVKTAMRYHLAYVDSKNRSNYVKKIINGFCSFYEMEAWLTIFGEGKMTISKPQIDGSKTLEWLYDNVAVFLGRYIANYGDDIMVKFLDIVNDEREKELSQIEYR